MFDFVKDSPLLTEARRSRLKPSGCGLLLIFWLIYAVSTAISSLPLSLYAMIKILPDQIRALMQAGGEPDPEKLTAVITEKMNEIAASELGILVTLFSTAIPLLCVILYCRFGEKRSLRSMGVCGNFPRAYGSGLLIGLVMLAAAVGICAVTGALTLSRNPSLSVGKLVLFFFAFMIQGTMEEFMLRGFLMFSYTNSGTVGGAILFSSILFSLMHFGNTGYGILPFINVLLFGLFLALYLFRTGNIFGACAIHGMWNFAEGCLFGVPVSGAAIPTTVFTAVRDELRILTNGGAFGIEGGMAVTVILIAALTLLLYWPFGKKPTAKEETLS